MKLMGLRKKTCMAQGNNNYKLPGFDLYVEIDRIKTNRSNTIDILINLQ